jgi:phenylalanine-4-hydroxylase
MFDPSGLRGDYSGMDERFVVPQRWSAYPDAEHDRWRRLYARQVGLVRDYASPAFLEALDAMDSGEAIPDFAAVTARLKSATGWSLVAVPGLVPDDVFFAHLAARRFPVTRWIREEKELDYIVEPDVFHDFFGHVPMLFQPTFAAAMQTYGRRGLELSGKGVDRLARLYWYVVEFGLEATPAGLKAFGAGILSSAAETVFAVQDPAPHRVRFDLLRVLRTPYRIDDFQETYFVLHGFEELLRAIEAPLEGVIAQACRLPDIAPTTLSPDDEVITRGRGRLRPAS